MHYLLYALNLAAKMLHFPLLIKMCENIKIDYYYLNSSIVVGDLIVKDSKNMNFIAQFLRNN